MGARERSTFELTLKGTDELAKRAHRLDVKARNILFLIQRGYPTLDGILENSIFPHEEVVERLRELLRGHFVTLLHAPDTSLAAPTTIAPAVGPQTVAPAASTGSGAETPTPESEAEPEPPEPPDPPAQFGL
jgi:hypothetical protein